MEENLYIEAFFKKFMALILYKTTEKVVKVFIFFSSDDLIGSLDVLI